MSKELLRTRIGNTVTVVLPVLTRGDAVSLVGRDITIMLVDPNDVKTPVSFNVGGVDNNIATFVVEGTSQTATGTYRAEVYENYRGTAMAVYDCDIFVLVARTEYENDGNEGVSSETTTLDPINIAWVGRDGYTPYIQDGYWYINGTSTNVKAAGENGDTPYIENGYWYIGGVSTGIKVDYTNEEAQRAASEQVRVVAEAARVQAEAARTLAENSRLTEESGRSAAEGVRILAERDRQAEEATRQTQEEIRHDNEEARVEAELGRAASEASRAQVEATRVANETARTTAEATRAANEQTRVSEETDRSAAETARIAAETARETAEGGRASAEATRVSNEQTRVSNEATRQSNESARQAAESARQAAYVAAEDARDAAFAAKEATRDAANQAALDCAETLAALGPKFGEYEENTEYIRVYADSEGKILWAIKKDGSIHYGAGVPSQVVDYINAKLAEIEIPNVDSILEFLDGMLDGEHSLSALLNSKVDKEEGKGLSTNDYTDEEKTLVNKDEFVENSKYAKVIADALGSIIEVVYADGSKGFYTPVKINDKVVMEAAEVTSEPSSVYLKLELDSSDKIVYALYKDGTHYLPKLKSDTLDELADKIAASVKEQVMGAVEGEVIEAAEAGVMTKVGVTSDDRDVIEIEFLTRTSASSSSEVTQAEIDEAASRIATGKYALISPFKLIYKDNNGNVSVVKDGVAETMLYRYSYFGKVGSIAYYGYNYAFAFDLPIIPVVDTYAFEINEADNQIIDYDIADWPFTTPRLIGNDASKPYYPQLELCYEFMDELVRKYPNVVIKYDPMATADYYEGEGSSQIRVRRMEALAVRNAMASAGWSDYPSWMQGIDEEHDETIQGYSVHLLPTPAYKTFIYRIRQTNPVNPSYGSFRKRKFLLQSGVHGVEVFSQIASCLFAETLLSANVNSMNLLANYEFYIIPCLEGYSGMHGRSWSVFGDNSNMNHRTPLWRYNDVMGSFRSIVPAGSIFSTRLIEEIMDYLNPDIYLDAHSLNNYIDEPPEINDVGVLRSDYPPQMVRYMADAAAKISVNLQRKYPEIYGAQGAVIPKFEVTSPYLTVSKATAYRFYSMNPQNAVVATIECNNWLAGNNATCNTSEALSAAAYHLRNGIYAICKYNLTKCSCKTN